MPSTVGVWAILPWPRGLPPLTFQLPREVSMRSRQQERTQQTHSDEALGGVSVARPVTQVAH
jgi:hypothetical protein